MKLSKFLLRGSLPNLCTETLGFNHSNHYKPSYSNFKKLTFWRIGPIRYTITTDTVGPPMFFGPIGLRLAVADLAGAHVAPPPPHYFSQNFEKKFQLTILFPTARKTRIWHSKFPRPPTSGFFCPLKLGLTWCLPPSLQKFLYPLLPQCKIKVSRPTWEK